MCRVHHYLSALYTDYLPCIIYGTRTVDLIPYQLLDNVTPAFPTAILLPPKQVKPAKLSHLRYLLGATSKLLEKSKG